MKVVDSINGVYETEETVIDVDGAAKIWISRKAEQEDGSRQATVYTNLPTLKEEIREYAECFPDLVAILVDDPEAEAEPETDTGVMQAVFRDTGKFAPRLLINPQDGVISMTLEEVTDGGC